MGQYVDKCCLVRGTDVQRWALVQTSAYGGYEMVAKRGSRWEDWGGGNRVGRGELWRRVGMWCGAVGEWMRSVRE